MKKKIIRKKISTLCNGLTVFSVSSLIHFFIKQPDSLFLIAFTATSFFIGIFATLVTHNKSLNEKVCGTIWRSINKDST
jgi:hypothetical protein